MVDNLPKWVAKSVEHIELDISAKSEANRTHGAGVITYQTFLKRLIDFASNR